MTDTLKIKVKIGSTNYSVPLGLEFWVDNKCVNDIDHVKSTTLIECDIDDDEGKHELRIVLKNKQLEHTTLDNDGNIVKDAMLVVEMIEIADININDLFVNNSQYAHSFNSNGKSVVEGCYGMLGCNGTVSLQFNTPFYLWLLENM